MITSTFDVILGEPYFYIRNGEVSEFTDLYWKLKRINSKKTITKVVRGQKCMTVEKLFDEFSAVYQFPYYFSANWNSFEECINDLAWLQADAYIMCISNAENLLQLSNSDFDSFTSILADSVREWQDGRNLGAVVTSSTPFNIIFHCAKENEYELIMKLRESGILLERL